METLKKTKKFWGGYILLIILAVWALKNFGIESFRISSEQMAETLLKNENILVSKWSYGLRLPQTPLALPFFHDTIPFIRRAAYLRNWQIPYIRLGDSPVRRNDVVVFNHPRPSRSITPVDRRKICISRCIGLPGDTVAMERGELRINGKPVIRSPFATGLYLYPDAAKNILNRILTKYGITSDEIRTIGRHHVCFLSRYDYSRIRAELPDTTWLRPVYTGRDNFQIVLPARNRVIRITPRNVGQLYPLILLHENEKVEKRDGKLFLEGRPLEYFLFKQNYYWMLSDQQEKGIDSRKFGPVPHSHLIGKGSVIWWSWEPHKSFLHGLRTDRIFKKVD